MIRKFVFVLILSAAGATSAMAQSWGPEQGYGYYGPGGSDVAGTNDNHSARNRGPFGPDGVGANYEYYRSSGPDRGNNIESQR